MQQLHQPINLQLLIHTSSISGVVDTVCGYYLCIVVVLQTVP